AACDSEAYRVHRWTVSEYLDFDKRLPGPSKSRLDAPRVISRTAARCSTTTEASIVGNAFPVGTVPFAPGEITGPSISEDRKELSRRNTCVQNTAAEESQMCLHI